MDRKSADAKLGSSDASRKGLLRRSGRPSVHLVVAIVAMLIALVVAGCGSGGGGDDGSSSGGDSARRDTAQAKAELQALYEGTYEAPPTTAPKPKPGANVWAIAAGYASESTAEGTREFKRAGEALGWQVTARDGKFDPSVQLAAVREAINDHADAIWIYAFDCDPVKAGVMEAEKAGIPVVTTEGFDCRPPLFSFSTGFSEGSVLDWDKAFGEAQAVWAIANTEGEGKALVVYENDIRSSTEIANGFKQRWAECANCTVTGEVTFTGAELGPPLQQKVEQALLQHPDTTVVYGNYDAAVQNGIAAAVRNSGRKVLLLGGEGQAYNIELVRKGQQSMGVGYPFGWTSYAGLDAINRILNGERPTEETGAGVQVYDATHNLPPKGAHYEPPLDFRTLYRRAWGIS